jgi:hypothetical protein
MRSQRGWVNGCGLALVALLLAAPAAGAQEAPASKWLPWLGCWEPVMDGSPDERAALLCFDATAEADVAELVRYAGGTEVEREQIAVRGVREPMAEGGCEGWQSAGWSADGRRVHLSESLVCAGGLPRSVSGVLAMVGPAEWIQVQSVYAGESGVQVLRYRTASSQRAAAAGRSVVPESLALAVQTARASAARPLGPEEVRDAARSLRTEVVEALLVERGDGFELNARTLLALRDGGVPESVIDLMVALSHPERFAINRAQYAGAPMPLSRDASYAYDPLFYPGGLYDAWGRPVRGHGPYGMSRYYGYGYGFSYGYGYGPRPYGTWYGSQPVIIVVRERESGPGRAIPRADPQRGYTQQPRTTSPTPTTSTSGASQGSSTTSGGAASSGSGRTAVPRTSGSSSSGGGGGEGEL